LSGEKLKFLRDGQQNWLCFPKGLTSNTNFFTIRMSDNGWKTLLREVFLNKIFLAVLTLERF
jgi:hypothetical protein